MESLTNDTKILFGIKHCDNSNLNFLRYLVFTVIIKTFKCKNFSRLEKEDLLDLFNSIYKTLFVTEFLDDLKYKLTYVPISSEEFLTQEEVINFKGSCFYIKQRENVYIIDEKLSVSNETSV